MIHGSPSAVRTQTARTQNQGLTVVVRVCVALTATIFTGCDQDPIQSYRAPKDPPHVARARPQPPSMATTGQRARMAWTVPEGWRQSTKKAPTRVATFEAGQGPQQIEVAVSAFPGDAGGLLANVNRWRGQLGLESIQDEQLIEHLTPFANTGIRGVTLDMTGPGAEPAPSQPAQRMIAAIIYDKQGFTWFIKTVADPGVLSQYKDQIVAFAGSFHLDDEAAGHDHGEPPPLVSASASTPASASQEIFWQTPPDWHQDPSPASFLIAAFDVNTPSGGVRVTVSSLPGDGGGALANVNRWRRQMGLTKMTSLDPEKLDRLHVGGYPAVLIDLASGKNNDDQARRTLVSMVTGPDRVWFFKLTGPTSAVAGQQDTFSKFLSTVGFDERQ